jgi:hypothetical protein
MEIKSGREQPTAAAWLAETALDGELGSIGAQVISGNPFIPGAESLFSFPAIVSHTTSWMEFWIRNLRFHFVRELVDPIYQLFHGIDTHH